MTVEAVSCSNSGQSFIEISEVDRQQESFFSRLIQKITKYKFHHGHYRLIQNGLMHDQDKIFFLCISHSPWRLHTSQHANQDQHSELTMEHKVSHETQSSHPDTGANLTAVMK
jgi:hypothetical protein